MNLLEKFTTLTAQHDEAMFQVFKKVIDDAKAETEKKWLDSISAFIFVVDTLKASYAQLALAMGIITSVKDYTEGHNNLIISEKLSEKIYTYLEPITQAAREEIKKKAEKVLDVISLAELQKEYNELNSLLENKTIQENSYVYEDIQFI